MTRALAIANQKGGVGKTTTAISLAAYLATANKRVLLVDMDSQANATSGLGFDKAQINPSVYDALLGRADFEAVVHLTNRLGLDLAPAAVSLAGAEVEMINMPQREHRLRHALNIILARYDFVLIDCPPSLNLLTVNALTAAEGVIIPVQCEYLALEGLNQLLSTIGLIHDNLNPRLRVAGLLMTMYDARTHLSAQVAEEVRAHFPRWTFRTVIPRSVRLAEAPSYGKSILDYAPNSPGALAYHALAQEVISREGPDSSGPLRTAP